MNETLQNALAEIITSALQNAGAAKDFILSEMPDVVQQLLWWKLAESLLMASSVVLVGVAIAYTGYRFFSHRPLSSEELKRESELKKMGYGTRTSTEDAELRRLNMRRQDRRVERLIFIIGGSAVGIVGFISNLTWLQILIAPKVYLIEYAAELVR